MNKQWHRDRINELKNISSDQKWTLMITTTISIGILSILYLLLLQEFFIPRKTFIIIGIIIIFYLWLTNFKKYFKKLKRTEKQITHNYDILLNRKK